MKTERKSSHLDGLLLLLLFSVFALCILLVLLTGADAYRELNQRDQESYDRRTAVQYLATRVRQADRLGGLEVEAFGTGDSLLLTEEINGSLYETRVYCWEGSLRELFTAAGQGLTPQDGEIILPAEDLAVTLEDGVLDLRLTDGTGQAQTLTLTLRSREDVTP